MPGVTRRISTTQENELRLRVLDILNDADDAMTIADIQSRDMVLQPMTSQKLTHVLAYLVEMGFVRKAKSKHLNRMVYKAVSKMEEQGYET
jgi:Fe2+ or Zn2+ uptake regulation protein